MLFSVVLAWISVVLLVLLAVKFIARVLGRRCGWNKVNQLLHHVHLPLGILLIVTSLLHGLLAGNMPGTALRDAHIALVLLTWNAGTLSLLLIILLGLSYLLRKKLRKGWMPLHRALTVAVLTALVCHLMATGIGLDDYILGKYSSALPQEASELAATPEPSTAPAAVSSIPSTAPSELPVESPSETPLQESAQETASAEDAAAESVEESEPVLVSQEPETPAVTFSGAVLADGVYTGSGEGFKGTITVEVMVQEGAVTDISVVSHMDTPNFFDWALTILDQILEQQSLEVDAVTGATWSSAGLQAAVYDALDDAVVEGELLISTITPTGGRHGPGH